MRRSDNRCPVCLVHLDNCFCSKITQIETQNKLSVILYKKEKWLPSNTANLSLLSLKNSQKYERGHKFQYMPFDFSNPEGYHSLYLYPTEEAQELTSQYLKKIDIPVNLIVPDGTWRQAKKIHSRERLLADIPHVKITPVQPSQYTLRRQKYEFGLCTHEAIMEAFKILEGERVYETLNENFHIFLEAHHKNRTIYRPEKKKGIHRDPQ